MLKYVRIAVTALCLTACVLLVALWVRSYEWIDYLRCPITGAHAVQVESKHGWLGILFMREVKLQVGMFSTDESAHSEVDTYWPRKVALIQNSRRTALIIPHWFALLLLGGIAVVPWMPGRFSLRTLLIAMTLVAVGLGTVIYLSG